MVEDSTFTPFNFTFPSNVVPPPQITSSSTHIPSIQSPFKVESKVRIKVFEGRMDVESLETWIQALEVYFSCQAYTDEQQVLFARLKMGRKSLLWWESFCRIRNQRGKAQVTSWNEFKREMRKNFYPLGYEDQLFLKWHHLK